MSECYSSVICIKVENEENPTNPLPLHIHKQDFKFEIQIENTIVSSYYPETQTLVRGAINNSAIL